MKITRRQIENALIEKIDELAADFPQHAADTGNPHSTTAAQAGAYSATETDALLAAIVNNTYRKGYWFGKTKADTVVPPPSLPAQNYFDFTANTPYFALADLSGWEAEAPIPPQNGMMIGISDAYLDLALDTGLPGRSQYSAETGGWDHFPDRNNAMDPLIFEHDSAGKNTVKDGGILPQHLAEEVKKLLIMPGQFGYTWIEDEEALALWRRMPADGRTIPVTDPRAERLLQHCLIPHALAESEAGISGLYLTNDNWPDHAVAAASGKLRATPEDNGAFLAIPDGSGLFMRGAGQNAFHKAANDAPYDGGAIGEFESFGTMGPPDYSNMESTNRINTNNGTWTVDRDGYVRIGYTPASANWAGLETGAMILKMTGLSASANLTFRDVLTVSKDTILGLTGVLNGNPTSGTPPECFFIPQRHNTGSLAVGVYITY
jgi:hypothetical protein